MPPRRAVLLTGATGFLGRYLLRDLLATGQQVCVLVRPLPGRSAEERVAELVAFGSDTLGRSLPQPVVLAGQLGAAGPALDTADHRWLGRHCRAVLHAAANLSFSATADCEPAATNVEGTRQLLRMCRAVGLSEWHHVSTAFVCGRRRGLIREEELDCGQEFRNPYERSKLEAERAVREAAGLQATVYRPAIIVGDSGTGYTTGYSGCYRVLELLARLAEAHSSKAARRPRPLGLRLPLDGEERFHLVPVDWVARAIVTLLARREWHGHVFHLVSRPAVPARLLAQVVSEELGLQGMELAGSHGVREPNRMEELFHEGLRELWPYLGGNPEFACTNLRAALPHLPPPLLDAPLLRRLVRFALADNWGRRPRTAMDAAPAADPDLPCAQYIERVFPQHSRRSQLARTIRLNLLLALDIRGPGGGQWSCRWAGGELLYVERGLDKRAQVTYHLDTATFEAVVEGRLAPQQAFFEQRLAISGDWETALKLPVLFAQFLRENPYRFTRREEVLHACRA